MYKRQVRLLQARFVKAFVMGNKNDVMDARAIWMAVQQPGKEIAVKTEEQQSVLVLHRTRRCHERCNSGSSETLVEENG